MPVNSTHSDYDSNLVAWLRAREVIAGEDAVKAAGERYLPKIDSQTEDEYSAYKERASFFNATARTVDGLLGLTFRREPTVKFPDGEQGDAAHTSPRPFPQSGEGGLFPARLGHFESLLRMSI